MRSSWSEAGTRATPTCPRARIWPLVKTPWMRPVLSIWMPVSIPEVQPSWPTKVVTEEPENWEKPARPVPPAATWRIL